METWSDSRILVLTRMFDSIESSNVDVAQKDKSTKRILREITSKRIRENTRLSHQHTIDMLTSLQKRVVKYRERFEPNKRRNSRSFKRSSPRVDTIQDQPVPSNQRLSVATTKEQSDTAHMDMIQKLFVLLVEAGIALQSQASKMKTINNIIPVTQIVCIPAIKCDICYESREEMLETACKHLVCKPCLAQLITPVCPTCRAKLNL